MTVRLSAGGWWSVATILLVIVMTLAGGWLGAVLTAVACVALGAAAIWWFPEAQLAAWADRLNRAASAPVGTWLTNHKLTWIALLACAAFCLVDWRVGLAAALITLLAKFLLARGGLRKGLVVTTLLIGGVVAILEWRHSVKSGINTAFDTAGQPYDDTKKFVSDQVNEISLPDVPLPRKKETIREIAREEATKIVDAKLGGGNPTPSTSGPPTTPSSTSTVDLRAEVMSRELCSKLLAAPGMNLEQLKILLGDNSGGADDKFALKGARASVAAFTATLVKAGYQPTLTEFDQISGWLQLRIAVNQGVDLGIPATGPTKSVAEILKDAGHKPDVFAKFKKHFDDYLAAKGG